MDLHFFSSEFYNKLRHRLDNFGDLLQLVDFTLTSVAVNASVSVGMWRRNGESALQRQHIFYQEADAKEKDLVLLQVKIKTIYEGVSFREAGHNF